MKYIKIHGKHRVYVKDEVYSAIETMNRNQRRQIEKTSKYEVLIGDENDFNKMIAINDKKLDEAVELDETITKVMDIIEKNLTAEEKYVIKTIFFDERPRSEIAEEMGLSYRTFSHRLNVILRKIKKIYDEEN